jgi:hypothetical protein
MPRYWEASQALVVRQETAGSEGPTPGKFADLYEMRTLQETILELAKSQQVVGGTIKAVDQQLFGAATVPSSKEIEEFRKRLKMLPPDGGEFGKSEVFYFCIKDRSRERAIALVGELCLQLEAGLKQLRTARAKGLTAELEEQVKLAGEIQAQETKRLEEFEAEVGADLGELRMLHSASSGQSDLREQAVQLEADLRKYQTQVREAEQLLGMLRAAEKDTQQLVATPNSLLNSQPALRRLKEGLVDAQLATARLGGTRSADHPRVQAAVEAERKIRDDLHRELVTAIRGAEAEVQLGQERVADSQKRLTDVEQRLTRLAERRAEYSNRVAAVDNSRITLDRARQNLSTARAAQAAAHSGSLVTRIDQPETGPYPAGPGRTAITGAGAVGGLMLGLGLVFLTTAPAPISEATSLEIANPESRLRSGLPLVGVRPATTEPAPIPWQETVPRSEPTLPPGVVMHPAPSARPAKAPVQAPAAKAPPTEQAPAVRNDAPVVQTGEPTRNASWSAEPAWTEPYGSSPTEASSRELAAVAVAEAPAKKAVLPATSGALPPAAGKLTPLAAVMRSGGMSLQEALEAARKAQR